MGKHDRCARRYGNQTPLKMIVRSSVGLLLVYKTTLMALFASPTAKYSAACAIATSLNLDLMFIFRRRELL